jgi:hypothetical protein
LYTIFRKGHDVSRTSASAIRVSGYKATAKAERMLAAAPLAGVDLRAMNDIRLRLACNEAMFNAAVESSKRKELEMLMARDIDELAHAYKMMARAVERGGEA